MFRVFRVKKWNALERLHCARCVFFKGPVSLNRPQ